MKITSVEPQKKNKSRFNIFLDGNFAFGADEDLVVDYRLVVGKEIDTPLLEKLLKESEVGKLMERMYVLFNIRQRSEKEARDYLKRVSFKRKIKDKEEISDLVIDSIIEKLKRKDMINDLQFAKLWFDSRSRKKGPIAIKGELIQKGINREIIEEVISHQSSVISSQEVAEKLIEKKVERWKNLPVLEFRKKAVSYLLRRGFEYESVKNIVEKILRKR